MNIYCKKMKFNRDNYELYVIDFLEGTLPENDHVLFITFLEDNPDIKDIVNHIHSVQLQPGTIYFEGKQILKKNLNPSQYQDDFDNYCIAYLEGDLDSAEKINFENWLSDHREKNNELELFRKAYLKADMSIGFSQKTGLKRRFIIQRRVRLISVLATAAAAIILLVIFIIPVDLIDRNIISEESESNVQVNTDQGSPEEIQEQIIPEKESFLLLESTVNEIEYARSKNVKTTTFVQSYADFKNEQDQKFHTRENISLDPVVSLIAQVENRPSVRYDILKKPDRVEEINEEKNFDEYQTLREYVNNNILSDFFSFKKSEQQEKTTIWDLALNGMEALNSITDGGYALDRKISENGNLKRISVETPLLGFSIPVKNKQLQ
ncbi:MAG: hypothetical protein JW864_03870 [Spirochaetes bacterium]|nr:hypothetical protein [Spirochaetota bacterium]